MNVDRLKSVLCARGWVEVDTELSGICAIYAPGYNPTGEPGDECRGYVLAGDGANWAPKTYSSLESLIQENDDIRGAIFPLGQAALGDMVDRRCEVCGSSLELHDIDMAENLAWLSCPQFLTGDDNHDSYSVPLQETGEVLGKVLTASEAAELWDLDNSTIRYACLQGRFRTNEVRRTGKNWIITWEGMKRVYGEPKSVECENPGK